MSNVEVYIQGEEPSVDSFPYKRKNVVYIKIDGQKPFSIEIEADEDRFVKFLSLTIDRNKETITHNFTYCGDNEALPTSINIGLQYKTKKKNLIPPKSFSIRLPFDYPHPHSEFFWHPNNLYPNIDVSKDKIEQLLNSREQWSIIWIHGATGIGKSTTLATAHKLLDKQSDSSLVVRTSALSILKEPVGDDVIRNLYRNIYNLLRPFLEEPAIIDFPHEDIKGSFAEIYRRLMTEKGIRSIVFMIDEFDVLVEWSSTLSTSEFGTKLLDALLTLLSPYNHRTGQMLSTCLLVADCLPALQRFGSYWYRLPQYIEANEVKLGYLTYSDIENILGSIPMPQELQTHLIDRLWVWTLGHPYCVVALLKEYFQFLHRDTLLKWRESNRLHKWPWPRLDDFIVDKQEDLKDLIKSYLTVDATRKVSNNRSIPRTTADQQKILKALAANKPLPEHIRDAINKLVPDEHEQNILDELVSRGLIFRSMSSVNNDLVKQWTIPIPLIRYLWQ